MELKKILLLIFLFVGAKAYSQSIERVDTESLVSIAEIHGLDSALSAINGCPIYFIDTITGNYLLRLVQGYDRYSKPDWFFSSVSHNRSNNLIKVKALELLEFELKRLTNYELNSYGYPYSLNDKLLISIIEQKPRSADSLIFEAYSQMLQICDSLHAELPSIFTRVLTWFSAGKTKVARELEECHMNCYKMMWTLRKLESPIYDRNRLNFHYSKLPGWIKNYDIERFRCDYKEYDPKIITLGKSYKSISSIDFKQEPELEEFLRSYDNEKCWVFLFQNKKSAIMNYGCRFAPLAGHGGMLKLELNRNELKISKLGEWIS